MKNQDDAQCCRPDAYILEFGTQRSMSQQGQIACFTWDR